MLGWSYSKVVIPIADFHTPFFSFLFSLGLAAKRKKPINHCGLIGLGMMDAILYRCIVDFTEGVDCILFKAVNDMEVSLSHLNGGMSEEA